MSDIYRYDPTKTATARSLFARRFMSRYRYVKYLLRESVVVNLCFGNPKAIRYEDDSNMTDDDLFSDIINDYDRLLATDPWVKDAYPLKKYALDGLDESDQAETFLKWMSYILGVVMLSKITSPEKEDYIWVHSYIMAAYLHGIKWGKQRLKANKKLVSRIGANNAIFDTSDTSLYLALTNSYHQDNIKKLIVIYSNLINSQIETILSKSSLILTDSSILNGSPNNIYNKLRDVIGSAGTARGAILANTESIRAHHWSSVTEYRLADADGVMVMAEWETARDSKVCPTCSRLDYKTTKKLWSIDEIMSMIPVHPRCRCAAIPHYN